MERTTVSSGTKWESSVGYSRAVRVGPHVAVSGTTATDESGDLVGIDDPHEQTERALANVERALSEAGASLSDVVRTRLFVVDIEDWELIGEAHAAVFGEIRPATSMVEVRRLIDPGMLVEVEADAIVTDRP
ncbi:RidA family protein [Natronorarus salvus]|uniref:RidA family protein n=1 Tax=Natronorarus salvus TaxID=3117733 RepID=UPI002F264334